MLNNFKGFAIKNIILTLFLAALGGLLFSTVFKKYYNHIFPILLILALIINLGIYRLAVNKKKVNQSLLFLVLSFAIKFFSYLIITVLFLLMQKDLPTRLAYIIVLLIVFVTYTTLEIKMLSKIFKTNV